VKQKGQQASSLPISKKLVSGIQPIAAGVRAGSDKNRYRKAFNYSGFIKQKRVESCNPTLSVFSLFYGIVCPE
jgi:hypothetical protein